MAETSESDEVQVTPRNPDIINEGDRIVLHIGDNWFSFGVATKNSTALVQKGLNVSLAPVIGHPWGSMFEVKGKSLVRTDKGYTIERLTDGSMPLENNAELLDDGTAQSLTAEEIVEMKSTGMAADELIAKIAKGSKTFDTKTAFAKEKYIAKKQKRHMTIVHIDKPTIKSVADVYFNKMPHKICNMRADALGLVLLYANVQPGANILVCEIMPALITASCVERMGGEGNIYFVHQERSAKLGAMQQFNFTPEQNNSVIPIHSNSLSSLYDATTSRPLPESGADSLIVAASFGADEITLALWPHLASSGAFAVFCPGIEPLAELNAHLVKHKMAVQLQLTESWQREYQVLPQRTHPEMRPTTASGFVLRGYKVVETLVEQAAKRVKTDE